MASDLNLPILDKRQIADLEAIFPPRCLKPGEDLFVHGMYAGYVALVKSLKDRAEIALASKEDGGDDDHFDTSEGEPAR